ncbi:glycoside hydrolase domain-containing protein, partial [Ferruginibacter sp.]|uniref:glycoside hydrolase domain-containing protein n=1 Tax=Ferruginibacter sp. TaxID=1940288 RepID=UPI0026583DFE
PASGIYAIGAPQFPKLTLTYKAGGGQPKTFTIVANKLSAENKYIQSIRLDGKAIDHPFISHASIINGKNLVFEMGPLPNKSWK